MLYGTPDDSAAQIAYIKKRGYPIGWIEMGEEPDGKRILPEDYAALYIQWAKAIHQVILRSNWAARLRGDQRGHQSLARRTGQNLVDRPVHRLSQVPRPHVDLAFVSLEHYPFEPCSITWKSLYREPQMMKHVWMRCARTAFRKIPIMVTESHISWRLTAR
jgi:hypothetical protein